LFNVFPNLNKKYLFNNNLNIKLILSDLKTFLIKNRGLQYSDNNKVNLRAYDLNEFNPYFLINYELKVLTLSEGDTVIFGNNEYVLGKFLGAGNCSQVFELKNDLEKVIKISLMSTIKEKHTEAARKRGNHFMRIFIDSYENMKNQSDLNINIVNVHFYPKEKDYVIVEKLKGFTLKQWLDSFKEQWDKASNLYDFLSNLDKQDFYKIKLLSLFFYDFKNAGRVHDLSESQIFFDEFENDWKLIDWTFYTYSGASSFIDGYVYQIINDIEKIRYLGQFIIKELKDLQWEYNSLSKRKTLMHMISA